MKRFISVAACGVLMAGVAGARAGEAEAMPEAKAVERPAAERKPEAPPMDAETLELRRRMLAVEQDLFTVQRRLGLSVRDRASLKDEELGKLYDAADAARKALEAKALAALKADAEGGPILKEFEEIQKQMSGLQQRLREQQMKLVGVRQRLGLEAGRVEAAPAASPDPELITLRTEAETARKALEDAVMTRIKADAEGAKLLQEREELKAKFEALRNAAAPEKPAAARSPAAEPKP